MPNVENNLQQAVTDGKVTQETSLAIEEAVNKVLTDRSKPFLSVSIEWSAPRRHPVLSLAHLTDPRPNVRTLPAARNGEEAQKALHAHIDEMERLAREKT